MTTKVSKKPISFFYKNILVMFRGTVIAQIISVFIGIYLAKLYGQEAYGYLGFFISITNISSIISTLQLDNCLITAKTKEDSINWLNFLLVIIPVVTILVFLLMFITSKFVVIEKLNNTVVFCGLFGSIIITYNLIHQNLFTYFKRFSLLSNSKIFIAFCSVFFQFLLYENYSIFGLIIGFIISQFLFLIFNFLINKKHIKHFKINKIKADIKLNSSLIKFLLPSNIINSMANNLMPILILTFFGVEIAGVYFFSVKILATPLSLISSSISQVFFKESSELYLKKSNELFKITKKIVLTNVLIMLLILIFINTVGIYALNLYFEGKWENLDNYILVLSFLILARSSFNPISSLIVVLDKNLIGLIFNIYLFAINITAIYIGYYYSNILITIYILSIFGGIGYFMLLYHFFNYLKGNKIVV